MALVQRGNNSKEIKLFRVQKKIVYAIEAVIDIALNSGPGPVQNESIAKRQGIPKRYLEQTLQILVKNKILVGSRGPKGGYSLARERRKINISEIIHFIFDENQNNKNFNSDLSHKIILPLIDAVAEQCLERFNHITVEDMCNMAKKKNIQNVLPKKVDFVI